MNAVDTTWTKWLVKDSDQIYWIFSSSVQSVAAFIALLLTGYVFVINVMDGLEEHDETLIDVNKELKQNLFKTFRVLAVLAGFSLISSVAMIYVNAHENWMRKVLVVPSVAGTIATFILGIRFILLIVDPKKYEKAANSGLEKEKIRQNVHGDSISAGDFMNEFIQLESSLRSTHEKYFFSLFDNRSNRPWPRTLSAILKELTYKQILSDSELELLKEIVKIRNLVVHGHQKIIEKEWLTKLKEAQRIAVVLEQRFRDAEKVSERAADT